MKALHLFAGAGGSVLAGHLLGWESVGCVEIDPFCCAVLEKNGEHVVGNDVTTFDGRQYVGSVDVVVGGSPCQDLSVAGKRAGLGGERSSLWHHQLRIAVECEAPFIFWENVRGALSSHNGKDFGIILRGLADAGYDARWGVFRASDVGAPHRRERVFLVAYAGRFGDERWGSGGVVHGKAGDVETEAHQREWRGDSAGDSREDVAHRDGMRKRQQKGRVGEVRGWTVNGGEGMDNTNSAQREGNRGSGGVQSEHSTVNGPGFDGTTAQRGAQGIKRGLGGAIDGLASWVDASNAGDFQWPAGKSTFQYPHEAPRVIAKEGQIRRMNRLKALGNGWVPQQAALAWRTLTNDL